MILLALEYSLNFIIDNFSVIVIKNVQKSNIFYFLITIMATISILYVILKLYKLKFSAPNEANIAKRNTTIQNFLSSFLIMIIFPFAFMTFFYLISEIQTIIFSFYQTNNKLLTMMFFKLGFSDQKDNNIADFNNSLSFWMKKTNIFDAFRHALNSALDDELIGFDNYSLMFGFIGSIAGILVIGQIVYYLFKGLFQLMMLFLYSPIPIFKRAYDNQLSFKA